MIIKAMSVLLAIAIACISVQQWRIHSYNQRIETLQSAVLIFKSAQATNLAEIVALKATVDDWKRKCAANEPEARQQAQLSVAADRKAKARLDANIKTLHAGAQNDVSVKTWYEQPVPAAAVRVLAQGGSTN